MARWVKSLLGAGVLLSLGVFTGAALVHVRFPINWDAVEWATWFQTIVAVGAIQAGFIGVRWQVERNESEKKKDRLVTQRELLAICCTVAASAEGAIVSSGEKIINGNRFIPTDRLEEALIGLQNLMARDIPLIAFGPLSFISSQIAYEISAIKLLRDRRNSLAQARSGVIQRRNIVSASLRSLKDEQNRQMALEAAVQDYR